MNSFFANRGVSVQVTGIDPKFEKKKYRVRDPEKDAAKITAEFLENHANDCQCWICVQYRGRKKDDYQFLEPRDAEWLKDALRNTLRNILVEAGVMAPC